ncbi:MAG: 2,3-bisphosphoglycerate-independent phosphoglycerate mutase [Candidatus Coatesbacteria bacterium]|nr:MAG: 2,3-bisphosphoglycerate-independent phosphoglycerate mutase [Candidatus Coatesbacteria bacterium]
MGEKTKIMIIICDGMGDRPIAELGNRTPLEAAETPRMDMLALRGETCIVDIIAPGVRPGSDTAHLALCGYDPYEYYTGRGPFEALGVGMDVRPGDVALRLNFSTVEERDGALVVLDRRAGRITEGTDELAAAVDDMEIEGARLYVKESTAHRAALVIRGVGLGHEVRDVDPHEVGVPIWKAEGVGEANEKTAKIINEFVKRSYEIFKEHPVNATRVEDGERPANVLLPRGVGLAPHIPPFGERYGLKGAAAVEVGLIRGIAKYLELDVIELPPSVTGGLDSDFDALFAAALSVFDGYDFLLINAKGPDVAGHDDDPVAKVEAIERIDVALEPVVEKVATGVHLALLADHSTPCVVGDHSGDPVPCLFYGPGVRTDDTATFGERTCAYGGAGRIRGQDALPILLQLSERAEKLGA